MLPSLAPSTVKPSWRVPVASFLVTTVAGASTTSTPSPSHAASELLATSLPVPPVTLMHGPSPWSIVLPVTRLRSPFTETLKWLMVSWFFRTMLSLPAIAIAANDESPPPLAMKTFFSITFWAAADIGRRSRRRRSCSCRSWQSWATSRSIAAVVHDLTVRPVIAVLSPPATSMHLSKSLTVPFLITTPSNACGLSMPTSPRSSSPESVKPFRSIVILSAPMISACSARAGEVGGELQVGGERVATCDLRRGGSSGSYPEHTTQHREHDGTAGNRHGENG